MQPPDKRKPVTGKVTGFLKIDMLASKIEGPEDTQIRLHLQAVRLRNRFDLSWPMARVVAELAFGRAA